MKAFILFVLFVALVFSAYVILKPDVYLGFYYPDKNNLFTDIQSPVTFDTIEGCRAWAIDQVSVYNPEMSGFDYECGKNCDVSGGKPYLCEETLK